MTPFFLFSFSECLDAWLCIYVLRLVFPLLVLLASLSRKFPFLFLKSSYFVFFWFEFPSRRLCSLCFCFCFFFYLVFVYLFFVSIGDIRLCTRRSLMAGWGFLSECGSFLGGSMMSFFSVFNQRLFKLVFVFHSLYSRNPPGFLVTKIIYFLGFKHPHTKWLLLSILPSLSLSFSSSRGGRRE